MTAILRNNLTETGTSFSPMSTLIFPLYQPLKPAPPHIKKEGAVLTLLLIFLRIGTGASHACRYVVTIGIGSPRNSQIYVRDAGVRSCIMITNHLLAAQSRLSTQPLRTAHSAGGLSIWSFVSHSIVVRLQNVRPQSYSAPPPPTSVFRRCKNWTPSIPILPFLTTCSWPEANAEWRPFYGCT